MSEIELQQMSGVDIMEIEERQIATFEEAKSLSKGTPVQTMERFYRKGYNPYFRKEAVSGCIVKISFANNGVRLNEAVADMLRGG